MRDSPARMAVAEPLRPELDWELVRECGEALDESGSGRVATQPILQVLSARPAVWVLADDRPGNTTQSEGLAEELGWPYERIPLEFNGLSQLPNFVVRGTTATLRFGVRSRLAPPWPDLVIAAGGRTAPVARWIKSRSQGRTRIVQLGRKGANPAAPFDLAVSPRHVRLLAHPRRIEIDSPLTRIRESALESARQRWEKVFARVPSPRVALLVGGSSKRTAFGADLARRLGEDVATAAEAIGASVFLTTSRRTASASAIALERALHRVTAHVHRWSPGEAPEDDPYLGYLAFADLFVVTGDSESMIAEACATRKPVTIYPLPERPKSAWLRLGDAVVARGLAPRANGLSRLRPDRALEYFCARLLERSLVRPNREMSLFHERLVERGVAGLFRDGIERVVTGSLDDTPRVAQCVRELMGVRD